MSNRTVAPNTRRGRGRPATGSIVWEDTKTKLKPLGVRVTYADGSRDVIDFEPGTTPELAEQLGPIMAAKARNAVRAGTGETVTEYASRWLAERRTRGLSSAWSDEGRVRKWVQPALGGLPIAHVGRRDVEAFVERLDRQVREGKLSWKTALNVWTVVGKMFDDACRSKTLALRIRTDNPSADVRGPDRGSKKAKCYLYPSEFLQLITCPDVPLAARRRYGLAVYLFPRAGELEALDWGDVDTDRGVVHIHRAVQRGGTKRGERRTIKETKTGITRRFAVEPAALVLLKAMRDECGGKGRVIAMLPDNNLARDLRDDLKLAKVSRAELFADDATRKPLGFHDLRATGLTWMAVRGDDPLKIMQRAGHTDFKTTQLYVREAEAVREGFGEVFPTLPESMITPAAGEFRQNIGRRRNSRRGNPAIYRASAEREGFEPSVGVTLRTLSKRVPSATRPPLQACPRASGGESGGQHARPRGPMQAARRAFSRRPPADCAECRGRPRARSTPAPRADRSARGTRQA